MKCISEKIIQQYIDNEIGSEERLMVEKHISECAECANNIKKQELFANFIKLNINDLDKKEVKIPDFVKPNTLRKKKLKRNILFATIGAACILAFFVLFSPKEKSDENYFILYKIEGEFDANKTFAQQEMDFYIVDSEGNIVEIF